jgi:hypothetical protein
MVSASSLLLLSHLVGLSLAVGGSTAKLVMLMRTRKDPSFLPVYARVSKSITRLIVSGIAFLALSGIGWLLIGYPFTEKLIVKLAMVVSILVMGPIIDNVIEPKFKALASEPGGTSSPEFSRIQMRYLVVELAATGMFYAIIVFWVVF